MHGSINVKSPNNTSKWQMGLNSAFKGLRISLDIGYLPLISVRILVWLMAEAKSRNDTSNKGRNDFSPLWSVLPASGTTQTPNPCVQTVCRQGFETDDTPPSTAGVAYVWNFVSTHPPLPNAFVVRTRATLTLPDMGCALDVNLILSLRNWCTALISVSVHTTLKIITPPFHKIQINLLVLDISFRSNKIVPYDDTHFLGYFITVYRLHILCNVDIVVNFVILVVNYVVLLIVSFLLLIVLFCC
jgi:hypothetical protein